MMNFLLVDDHTLIRTALKIILHNAYSDCAIDEASDSDSAIAWVKKQAYSLVIMDVSMPKTDSFALLNHILTLAPQTKVLIFSMNPEDIYARRYLSMAAMGYLRKDSGEEETRKAIATVLANKRYISQTLAEKIAEDSFSNEPVSPFDKLSARGFEVVQHLLKRESVAQICKKLNVNSSTMSSHKSRIFEKRNISNPVEII